MRKKRKKGSSMKRGRKVFFIPGNEDTETKESVFRKKSCIEVIQNTHSKCHHILLDYKSIEEKKRGSERERVSRFLKPSESREKEDKRERGRERKMCNCVSLGFSHSFYSALYACDTESHFE